MGVWRPAATLTWNGRCFSGPNGNGSSTSTRMPKPTFASGATTARGGWTASFRRASGSSAVTATSDEALPRFATMTWCLPTLLPREVTGTMSAATFVNGVTEIRPSSTVEPAGSAAGRTRIPNG